MENKNVHIVYGFVSGIVMVIVGLALYFAGLAFNKGMQYAAYIPLLAGVILNGIAFSKANDGYVTFGKVFGSCFKVVMVATIVMIAWSILSIFIMPEMKEKALSMVREEMMKNPKITDDQVEMSLNVTKKYWNVIVIGTVLFANLFYGAIFSLLGALIAQKKGERPITASNF